MGLKEKFMEVCRFLDHKTVLQVNQMKEPGAMIPKEAWSGAEKEVGVFPTRLQELIEALRRLKHEVKTQKEETMLLRKALMECEACKIKKPLCTDLPYPCFEGPPRVDCRDTTDGPECGPCPPGYKGNGRHCERDACGDEPCFEGVSCYPTLDPPHYKCGPCPAGFRGDGLTCMPDICQKTPASLLPRC